MIIMLLLSPQSAGVIGIRLDVVSMNRQQSDQRPWRCGWFARCSCPPQGDQGRETWA